MKGKISLLLLVASLSVLLGGTAVCWAAPPSIGLTLLPDSGELDPEELRESIARELHASVVLGDGDGEEPLLFTLTVGIDREHRLLVVERDDRSSGLSRRVALPDTPAEILRVATYLAGNLARDEAAELLRELLPAAAPPPPLPPPPAPDAGPKDATPPATVKDDPDEIPVRRPIVPKRPPTRRFWLGLWGQIDSVYAPGSNDACGSGQYYCLDGNVHVVDSEAGPSGVIFPGKSEINGGLSPTNKRLLASFDYAVTDNLRLGVRVGYVGGTAPVDTDTGGNRSPLSSMHAELRGMYLFGDHPLARAGLSGYVTLAAGLGEWSASVVTGSTVSGSSVLGPVTAWHVAGREFIGTGPGLRWAFTDRTAALLGMQLDAAFGLGSVGLAGSFEFGLELGL